MYRMLTGKYPFTSKNTAQQILNQKAIPVNAIRPEIPVDVADIVRKAMAKDDGERYQSAAEFAQDIEIVVNRLYPDSNLLNTTNNYMEV